MCGVGKRSINLSLPSPHVFFAIVFMISPRYYLGAWNRLVGSLPVLGRFWNSIICKYFSSTLRVTNWKCSAIVFLNGWIFEISDSLNKNNFFPPYQPHLTLQCLPTILTKIHFSRRDEIILGFLRKKLTFWHYSKNCKAGNLTTKQVFVQFSFTTY